MTAPTYTLSYVNLGGFELSAAHASGDATVALTTSALTKDGSISVAVTIDVPLEVLETFVADARERYDQHAKHMRDTTEWCSRVMGKDL